MCVSFVNLRSRVFSCIILIYYISNTEFLRLVSPLFPFVKLLIQATNEIDLEKENIRLSFE